MPDLHDEVAEELGGDAGLWDDEPVLIVGELILDCREIAKRLHYRHWTLKRIGRALSVSPQTVSRWVDPEIAENNRAGSLAWKHAHRKECKIYDRQHRIDSKVPCPWCTGRKSPDRVMCRDCRQALTDFRYSVLIGCWEDGWLITDIADAFQTTVNALNTTLNRLRHRGEIGYRYRVGPDGLRLPDTYRLPEVA